MRCDWINVPCESSGITTSAVVEACVAALHDGIAVLDRLDSDHVRNVVVLEGFEDSSLRVMPEESNVNCHVYTAARALFSANSLARSNDKQLIPRALLRHAIPHFHISACTSEDARSTSNQWSSDSLNHSKQITPKMFYSSAKNRERPGGFRTLPFGLAS
jgi:hypothetical protein